LTDLAERMLAVARENAVHRGLRNVETRVCDAGALPFADASFDAVLCRFGFMFFPDMTMAANELARVARPGARVSTAVWGKPEKNPWATITMGAIGRHVDHAGSGAVRTRAVPLRARCLHARPVRPSRPS
jgi:ubiquinone/menaquinone biosynthesis C-methylase UbiE